MKSFCLTGRFGSGDIIVFKFPFDDHPHYVKRVIGLPGDHIRIVSDQVYVNGAKKRSEPYVVHDPSGDDPAVNNFPPSDQPRHAGRLAARSGPRNQRYMSAATNSLCRRGTIL